MASTRLPTVPENPTGSWSSTKFRKMLLIESIASVFSKQDSDPAIPRADTEKGSRHESTSTDGAEQKTIACRDIAEEEKAGGRTLEPTGASGKPVLKQENPSDGSRDTTQPGEAADISADPMANHTEGGINYRSLRWW